VIHLVLSALLIGTPSEPAPDSVVAFVNVGVVPMDRDRVLTGQTVIVRGGRISAVGPADQVKVPAGSSRIEGRGKFLMPGLAEMHAHIPGGNQPDSIVERVLFLYVSRGVTTIRGMLGHPKHLALREQAAGGKILSPTIYTSGPSLNGNSVPDAATAARLVTEQKAAGYDFLKIHPGISREAFDTLAATAHRQRIPFAGHVPLDVGLSRALTARYATIDHLDGYVEGLVGPGRLTAAQSEFFGLNLGEQLDESKLPAVVQATREAGVWNVPTQVLMENLAPSVSVASLEQRPEMRYVLPETRAAWAKDKGSILTEIDASAESAERVMQVRRKLLKALHAGGAGLLLGSDAPQIYNVPGFSVHRELESLVAAGLTPYQALETGTRNVARFFGTLPQTGTIEAGKRADLILLDGNPLTDIRNSARQSGVMLRGRWLPKTQIDERLAAIAKAAGN
jgi:Amidohydrolase family